MFIKLTEQFMIWLAHRLSEDDISFIVVENMRYHGNKKLIFRAADDKHIYRGYSEMTQKKDK